MLGFLARTLWLVWCWIELAVFTLVLYFLSWLPQALLTSYFRYLFRVWCSFFVRALGVDLRLHEKNLKSIPRQYILIANHPSALEDVGIPTLFNVTMLAKAGVRKWWLVGRINEAAGTVFVDRNDPDSRHASVDTLIEKLQQGCNIALFPEGGCRGRRIHHTFYPGAFDISMRTGIPILPVFLHYEAQETFEWRDPQTLLHKFWHFMTSLNDQANYYVYDAIYPDDFKDKKEFAEAVRQKYLHWQTRYLE
ncbi:lysophospholipid acyltransferase family protein [Kaarinaea lacus]